MSRKTKEWKVRNHSRRVSMRIMRGLSRANRINNKIHKQHILSQRNSKVPVKKLRFSNPRHHHNRYGIKVLAAPQDFRLLNNTCECLNFFSKLRNPRNIRFINNTKQVSITLRNVIQLDYATISIFKSIIEEMKDLNVLVVGDFPTDAISRRMMINSGFLSHMYNQNGRPFSIKTKSDLLQFEKGTGLLTEIDSRRISQTMNSVASVLLGQKTKCSMLKSLLLEICGNTIEWSNAHSQRWMLGVIYNSDNSVTITVTDIGKGILGTLFSKFKMLFEGISQTDPEILLGAFNQKYGSNTKENNRNQGLRLVKRFFEENCLLRLKVLTNNVLLDFDNLGKSLDLSQRNQSFNGTFFQWELDKQCIIKINSTLWN